jgi:hypothetical protein
MTSISARPGTLVEHPDRYEKQRRTEVERYIVKHLEDPTCQVLLMKATNKKEQEKRSVSLGPLLTPKSPNSPKTSFHVQSRLLHRPRH